MKGKKTRKFRGIDLRDSISLMKDPAGSVLVLLHEKSFRMNEPKFERPETELDYHLNNPMTSVKELAEVIEPNDALKERVIARANSASKGVTAM